MGNEEYLNAGRCYAFGLYTAAGYHCCRSVEAVLREYYRLFVGKPDIGTETWGTLIVELEKLKKPNAPDPKTLSHLRHVKDYDRNPLSHLRAVLDVTDADLLLSSSKVAIMAMASEAIARKLAILPVGGPAGHSASNP